MDRKRRQLIAAISASAAGSTLYGRLAPIGLEQCKLYDVWPTLKKTIFEKFPMVLIVSLANGEGKEAIDLANTKNRKLLTLLAQLPVVFINDNQKSKYFSGNLNGKNFFLADPKGNVLKSSFIKVSQLNEAGYFYDEVEKLVIKDGTFKKVWDKFSKPSDGLIKELNGHFAVFKEAGYKERAESRKAIRSNLKSSIPVLREMVENSDNIEQRETCRDLLLEYSQKIKKFNGVPVQVQAKVHVACGMASMNRESRHFLTLYTLAG